MPRVLLVTMTNVNLLYLNRYYYYNIIILADVLRIIALTGVYVKFEINILKRPYIQLVIVFYW
jgi:hypothetical protein